MSWDRKIRVRPDAIKLLCKVDYYEDRDKKRGPKNRYRSPIPGRRMVSVGVPYVTIIERLRKKFPKTEVSLGSLRWYVSHLRVGTFGDPPDLPWRRARPEWHSGRK